MMGLCYNVLRGEGDCGCHELSGNGFPERDNLRSRQLTPGDLPLCFMDANRDYSCLLLKGHCERRPDLAKLPGAGKYKRGSNVRVPGKRHLARRCEDAHLACVPHLRWENERALGEVEFPRNLLHLLLREAVSLGEDSQRISAKSCLCEHVACKVLVLHRRYLVTSPCQSPMAMQIRPAPP